MSLRLPFRFAAAAGLWLSQTGLAAEPARIALEPPAAVSSSPDQATADSVAQRLGQSSLRGYQVEIVCENGVVDLVGSAQDGRQRDEIVRIVKGTAGVKNVRDMLTAGEAILPVNGQTAPIPLGPPHAVVPGLLPGGAGAIDPAPLNGGYGAAFDLAPPKMPPYAWPTYAPHNNYSRVAYPDQYPAAAFPFIGPFYPFPKVPLGFRAIKLEWEDGHWWYGRNSTRRDFWSVRYW